MRNNLYVLALCLLAISALPSCKKDAQTCKLGQYYVSDGNTTPAPEVYSYYDNGDLKLITHTNGTRDTIIYTGDSIFISTYTNNNNLIAKVSGIRNSSGQIASAVETLLSVGGNVISSESIAYEYTDGKLSRKAVGNSIISLNYINGDAATGVVYADTNQAFRFEFFHSTAENKTGVGDIDIAYKPWYGKGSLHLLDSTYIIYPTDTVIVRYTHTLDANGYINSTVKSTFSQGVSTQYHTFQYFGCE